MSATVTMWEWSPERWGRLSKPKSFAFVAVSPHHAFSSDTMYLGNSLHQPTADSLYSTYFRRFTSYPAFGIDRLPGNSWMMAAVRMYWTPTECWVHPTA